MTRFKIIALSGLVAGATLLSNGCVTNRLWNWFDFAATSVATALLLPNAT